MNDVLRDVGPRLRAFRHARSLTLEEVAVRTGISSSTLSRLESGGRRPTLELLLPLSQCYELPLDELVGAPSVGDPRVHPRPVRRKGVIVVPLTHLPGPQQALKMILPSDHSTPVTTRHEGVEWLYVLSGRLRLIVGDHDVILEPGQAAEFDTRAEHLFGSTGNGPVEILSLLGRHGERVHLSEPAGE